MATIQTADISKELNLEVRYIEVPADMGEPATVELVSVKLYGVEIPVSKALAQAIRDDLMEMV